MQTAMSAAVVAMPLAQRHSALKPAGKTFKTVTVSNGNVRKTAANMQVWTPVDNKFFETFSFLPPLSAPQIAKQVDAIIESGNTPCLEFADPDVAYIDSKTTVRMEGVSANYYDNRYWTMWKLPMFGCTDPSQVLQEVDLCTQAFPDAYIRLVAFDATRQVQITGFLVHRPASCTEYQPPSGRSVGDNGSSANVDLSSWGSSGNGAARSRSSSVRPSSRPAPVARPSSRPAAPSRPSSRPAAPAPAARPSSSPAPRLSFGGDTAAAGAASDLARMLVLDREVHAGLKAAGVSQRYHMAAWLLAPARLRPTLIGVYETLQEVVGTRLGASAQDRLGAALASVAKEIVSGGLSDEGTVAAYKMLAPLPKLLKSAGVQGDALVEFVASWLVLAPNSKLEMESKARLAEYIKDTAQAGDAAAVRGLAEAWVSFASEFY